MRRAGPIGLTLGAALLALLLAAPSASAAVRYATPFGSNAEPCNPTPCNLPKAVNGASDGDEVVVGPGTYKPSTAIDINHSIDVGGQPGAPFPVVQLTGQNIFFEVENAGAVVHDLRFERFGETMGRTLEIASGTAERVIAIEGAEAGGACLIASGALRDSVCAGFTEVDAFGAGSYHVVLRNDTFGRTLVGASSGANLTVDAANVIMHSESASDYDLTLDVNVASTGAITLTHSNYATVSTTASAGTGYSYTAPGTNGNQTAPPQFVDAAAGDFHELASSPTVDAGLVDPLIGATDLDGSARSLPSCLGAAAVPDIGAYELAPTAACPQPSASQPPGPKPSNIVRFGKLKRNAGKGTAFLAVRVPGAGSLKLTGKGLVRQHASPHTAGTVELAIKAKGGAGKKLRGRGRLAVKVAVTFTPVGGDAATTVRRVKLIRHRQRAAAR